MHDEIRNSAAGRSLALGRSVAETFRQLGWSSREGAAYSREGAACVTGLADVAATRSWERKNRETRVHLVVRCELAGQALFSEASRATDDVIASHAVGDTIELQKLPPSPPPPAAPRARVHASAFRAEEPFRSAVDEAFAAIDQLVRELRAHDLDVVRDDIAAGAEETETLAPLSRRRDLVHSIVVTDAALRTLGDSVKRHPWLRLHRARVIGMDDRWIDIVGVEAFAKYAAAVTRHYAAANRR
jgi:hypothetical protein